MKSARRVWTCTCALFLGTLPLIGQTRPGTDSTPLPMFEARENIPAAISFLSIVILPKVFQDEYLLKDYIRGDAFARFRKGYGDLAAVDAIFDRAMRLSWNNIYEALLISSFAVMDHARFGVRLPFLGPLLWFPLTSECEDDFRLRIGSLPARLYPDTPPGEGGDRDKLQHFFGSAFLAYTFESRPAADRVGEFIEWGEERYIVDGSMDERDLRANRQGQQFGLRLLDDPLVLPSAFWHFQIASERGTGWSRGAFITSPDSVRTVLEDK